jgi:hypothetical protein
MIFKETLEHFKAAQSISEWFKKMRPTVSGPVADTMVEAFLRHRREALQKKQGGA